MKKLVLAEKPSVGRDIAKVLNCKKTGNGYIEGDKYIVTWALGHLVTLAKPSDYDKKYEEWDLQDLPIIPSYMKLKVIGKTSKQFNAVKKLMLRNDVDGIIIATDSGREGELVGRWIIEKVGVKKPIKRLWISSVTDKAIKEGFRNLKDGREYLNLYASAVARSEADWIVGLNASRALTCQFNTSLSCGRVQTPTLEIIKSREDEIKSFVSETYYGIDIECKEGTFKWYSKHSNNTRSFKESEIDKIIMQINNKSFDVINVNAKLKKKYPQGLYDLTELQRDANRIFNYSAKETLSIMQKLYEYHKVLTYPRTDSKYLSNDIVDTLKDRIRACGYSELRGVSSKILKNNIHTNKSFVDDKKVSDHHAIIPTEESPYVDDFTNQELNIYNLVVKRFLSVFMPPYEYEELTIEGTIGSEIFKAKGKRTIKLGFEELNKGETKDVILSKVNKGDKLKVLKIKKTKGQTEPPKRFTEGTLLQAMENPVKYMKHSNKELANTLNNTGGLGTVATRADIIEKLYKNLLIVKSGKQIMITSKGRQLLDLVPSELRSPELTAKWEQKLNSISEGSVKKQNFINEMKGYTKKIVREIKDSESKFKHDNITGKKCPQCGKFLLEIENKNGKYYKCQDAGCRYRKNVYKITNSRCPNCHKKLTMYGEGENKTFSCACGHKEKISTFNKRKQESKSKMSKRDVQNYLNKQNKKKDDDYDNPFADAFKNYKFDE